MEKLTRNAKRIDIVLRLLFWLQIISGIIAILGLVLSIALDGVEGITPMLELDLDFVSLELAEDAIPSPEISRIQRTLNMAGVVMLVAGLAVGIYCIRLFREILRPMKEGQPFRESVSHSLKKLGWVELIGGTVIACVELAMEYFIIYGFNLKELLLNDKISHVSFMLDIDLNFVVAAAVCFLLSYIFRYGTQLQQLSDETL
ncbi:MAG: DUF3611 family protein [Oscillospiraceae bacterium]|nr:DUF3611 family protein [Oscillospiraceae bacterium]